ncbi:AAA family ATPase [Geomonas propionica]|uniref:AAA family ATPase n=1 Tax=Geomonas propionica TaxID=2798582 RepID=A0ABS0YRR4_9BACT|nr:AAA family ATPase [Geomonas propionica]MBJ6800432.1 AAA family ATPase [Geomonas propionica]
MATIVVQNVAFAGTSTGAIFTGACADGSVHRLVASRDVMPRPPVVGEVWSVSGVVQTHPVYGRQVVTRKAVLERPSGRLITACLAKSTVFPGIGPKTADQLWRRFGEDIYAMLDKGDPALFEVPLHSKLLARILVSGWQTLALESDTYRWLDRHGAPVSVAEKIADIYQGQAVAKLEDNPYRLLAFCGWEVADRIARSMGVAADDPRRLVAVVDTAVMKMLRNKHTWESEADFLKSAVQIGGLKRQAAARAVELAMADNAVLPVAGGFQGIGPASMERYIADMVAKMAAGEFQASQLSLRFAADRTFLSSFLAAFHETNGLRLNKAQQDALSMALREPICIVCGGAGVGKTWVLKAFCTASERLARKVYLLALSGRAARRMEEATGHPALTIASFLHRVRQREIVLEDEPVIAVDEASMLDLPISYRLLRHLEPGCRLLLLGDPGQLPPISFGIVFHTLVESALPKVELTQVHRQSAATGIPQAAAALRAGVVPGFSAYAGRCAGLQFIDCTPESVQDLLCDLYRDLGGIDEVRILSPVKAGPAGTHAINRAFHQVMAAGVPAGAGGFAVGEPVIWTQNDYDLGLMNGSLGIVVRADGPLVVNWDGLEVSHTDLSRMEHAYAITVHKSQGSQFKRVIIPIFNNKLLDRTMVYTAITRAREQVVLLGARSALHKAVTEPPSSSIRRTGLALALEKATAR